MNLRPSRAFALALFTCAPAAPAAAGELPVVLGAGLRSTVSLFNQGSFDEGAGLGTGGQLRVQVGQRVGSEWYYDYLTNQVDDGARRVDEHIGWSILFYPWRADHTRRLTPYVLSGHCFDYTRLSVSDGHHEDSADRWSSAVQVGAGSQLNITPDVDLSLAGQYMIHLGNDLHYDGHAAHRSGHGTLEGHVLITASVNWRFRNPG